VRLRAVIAILAALTLGIWVLRKDRSSTDALEAADLDGARAAFHGNVAAIQHRNKEEYLSYYMQSPAFTVLSDSFSQGYEAFAAARRAQNDWPDTLIAGEPNLVWLSPGVVYGAYRYVRVQGGQTTRGWSERVFIKTKNGWKIAVSTAFKE
jgi:hypothetical protein